MKTRPSHPSHPAVESDPTQTSQADLSAKPSKTTKSLIYARFSPRPKKDMETESIETQLEYCEEYCKHHGYTVESVFADRAISGKDEDRPGLWNCIEAIQRGTVLVVYKFDRLARENFLAEYIRREVQKRGGSIASVTQAGMNGDTPDQVFIRQILQAFSEFERKMTAMRTSAAMQRHQRTGRRMSFRVPYGWRIDPENPARMIADADELETIRLAKQMQATNNCSLGGIGKMLADMNRLPRTGKGWTAQQVKCLLAAQTA